MSSWSKSVRRALACAVASAVTIAGVLVGAGPAVAAPDTSAPELVSFSVHAADTLAPGDTVTVDYTATDDSDAVEVFLNYEGPQNRSFSLNSNRGDLGTLTDTFTTTISNRDASGTYQLKSVSVRDRAWNQVTYWSDGTVTRHPRGLTGPSTHTLTFTGTDLTITGSTADTTAPELTSFTLSPPAPDRGEPATIDYRATDDGPVLTSISFLFEDELGGTYAVSDSWSYGEWKPLTGRLQAYGWPVPGRMELAAVLLQDRNGNTSAYSRDGSLWVSTRPDATSRHSLDLTAGDYGTTSTQPSLPRQVTSLRIDGIVPGLVRGAADSSTTVQGTVLASEGSVSGTVGGLIGNRYVSVDVKDGAFSLTIPKSAGKAVRLALNFYSSDGGWWSSSTVVLVVRPDSTSTTPGQPVPGDSPTPPAPAPGAGSGSGGPAPSTPPAAPAPAPAPAVEVLRLSGADRIATSVAVSRADHPKGAPAAVLTSAAAYADAIGGGRLASSLGAPLLLTSPEGLRSDVVAELRRLLPAGATVYVLGGRGAISEEVDHQLHDAGLAVRRLQGADRFETARKIADVVARQSGGTAPIYLASGRDFPDGLAVSALAAKTRGVVLLTDGASMPAATAAYLAEHDPSSARTTAVGGPAARAASGKGDRIAGRDRYETAALVAERFSEVGGSPVVGLAKGTSWADALIGGASVGLRGGPLLLTSGSTLDERSRGAVAATGARAVVIYGGPSAVTPSAVDATTAALSER